MPGSSTAPTWLSLPQGSAGRGFGVTIQSTSSGTATGTCVDRAGNSASATSSDPSSRTCSGLWATAKTWCHRVRTGQRLLSGWLGLGDRGTLVLDWNVAEAVLRRPAACEQRSSHRGDGETHPDPKG